MRNFYLLLFLCSSLVTYSQNAAYLNFWIDSNNMLKIDGDPAELSLPVEFTFTKDFKDLTIQILNNSNKAIALKNGKFGHGQLSILEDAYVIGIDENGNVNPHSSDDEKINSKIKLKIGNYNPITILFNDNNNEDINIINKPNINKEYQPGYIYFDAIKLSKYNDTNDVKQIKDIFEAYGIDSKIYSNNPYLNTTFPDLYSKITPSGGFSLLTNLGNTDITYFAEGMARFLAERTKDELNEAFFNKMKKQLNAYPELAIVFPKTTTMLNSIDSYSYASVLQVLKESFETDIRNLPLNLYEIQNLDNTSCNSELNDKQKKACNARMNSLETFFRTKEGLWTGFALFTVREAYYTKNPADLLREISENSKELDSLKAIPAAEGNIIDHNFIGAIQLSNLLSQSLISKDESQIWVTPDELKKLMKNSKALKIYLGLLLAKEQTKKREEKIVFYNYNSKVVPVYFESLLISENNNINELERLIQNIHSILNQVNQASREIILSVENSQQVNAQSLYTYYNAVTSSVKSILKNKMLEKVVGDSLYKSYLKVDAYLTPSVDLTYHIFSKAYLSAIYDASLILQNLSESNEDFKSVTKSFVKYGTLVSTVAMAESSDEVKKAIESSVLPVGSSSIKRNTNWSCSINAYVGGFWSYNTKENYPAIGMSAPIGFNVSKGLRIDNKNLGSLSLNLQAIDLGALVNYYLIEGDTASLPNDFSVKLSNVFSPGVNLTYNIPSTPISLSWGVQYIPTLYEYAQISEMSELVAAHMWRQQISILIDIPLFNLKVWDY